jgi:hypothetical protein
MSSQKSEIVLCLLPLIESGGAGLRADAAAADVIAACARFNMWVFEQKMAGQGSVDGFLQLLDFYEEVTLECQAAVQLFLNGGERGELADTLQRVAEKLNQRRSWISNWDTTETARELGIPDTEAAQERAFGKVGAEEAEEEAER